MEEQRYNFLNFQRKTLESRGPSYTASRLGWGSWGLSQVPVTPNPWLWEGLGLEQPCSSAFPKGAGNGSSSFDSSICSPLCLCLGSRSFLLPLVPSSWLHVGEPGPQASPKAHMTKRLLQDLLQVGSQAEHTPQNRPREHRWKGGPR